MAAMVQAKSGASEDGNWDRHWSAYAESNVLNPAQAYRKELIFARLGLGRASGRPRVLDIGSGQGELSREIKRRYPEVEIAGLDLSATGLEEARRTVQGARFFQQDVMRPLAWRELAEWATHAVCSEVLEHVSHPVQALANIRGALAPGCRLVLTVPSGPMSAFDRHIGHLRHFTASSLETTLRDAGYSTLEVDRAGFPFFNLYRLTVVARGKKLIEDAAATRNRELPMAARLAMGVFGTLFRFNSARTSWGWQLVAVATP